MDSATGIAIGGVGLGVIVAAFAQGKADEALMWGQSASVLRNEVDQALEAIDRGEFDPVGPAPRFTKTADRIQFGYRNMSGTGGPNEFSMAAVAPLRRASTMPALDGIAELRAAAQRALPHEVAALRATKVGIGIALGIGAVTAGALGAQQLLS